MTADDNAWDADRLISPRDVIFGTWNGCSSATFVADVSGSSFGLRIESGYLLGRTAKEVVPFYRLDLEKRVSILITGNTDPNCTLIP